MKKLKRGWAWVLYRLADFLGWLASGLSSWEDGLSMRANDWWRDSWQ